MTQRALVLCPGRGSYGKPQLGSLQGRASAFLDVFDEHRAALGRPTVRELDGRARYSARFHIAGEHASILTAGCSLSDFECIDAERVRVVGVAGNSMGWYSALVAAGAVSPRDGARLIETMGAYQANNVVGGQLLYPIVDSNWRPEPSLLAQVESAVSDIPDLHWSIRLGGQAVLGGTDAAVAAALKRLPPLERGTQRYPLKLPLHSAFHTPVMRDTQAAAQADLASIGFRAPRVPLVDGQGQVWPARYADPGAIAQWTLGAQVVDVFDFTAMVASALGELAPDVVILPGPGSNLGGAIAQVMIAIGWQGLRNKADFIDRQRTAPLVVAMSRPDQRPLVASP